MRNTVAWAAAAWLAVVSLAVALKPPVPQGGGTLDTVLEPVSRTLIPPPTYYAIGHELKAKPVKGHRGLDSEFNQEGFWLLVNESSYQLLNWAEIDAASIAVRGVACPRMEGTTSRI